jgi:hypothetical protein
VSATARGDADVLANTVARHTRLKKQPVCILSSADQISDTGDGMLVVVAIWSMPAILAFTLRTMWLESYPRAIRAFVIDSELVPPGGPLGDVWSTGWGETFLFRKGQIIRQFRGHRLDERQFHEYLDEILSPA